MLPLRRRATAPRACAYVGGATGAHSTGGSVDLALPAGAVAGMLCVVATGALIGYPTAPSGFSTIDVDSASSVNLRLWHKLLTPTDISAGKITTPAFGSNRVMFAMGIYWGPTSVALASSAKTNSSSGSAINIPGFSPDRDVLGLVGAVHQGLVNPGTATFPAGWSQRGRAAIDGSATSLHDLTEAMLYAGGAVTVSGLPAQSITAAIFALS